MNYEIQRPIAKKSEGQESRDELYSRVAKVARCQKKRAKLIISAAFDEMAGMVADGWDIAIPRFGRFVICTASERPGVNPMTGEKIIIPERKKIRFKPSSPLKRVVMSAPDEKVYLKDKEDPRGRPRKQSVKTEDSEDEEVNLEEYDEDDDELNDAEYFEEDQLEEYIDLNKNNTTDEEKNVEEEDDADEWLCI